LYYARPLAPLYPFPPTSYLSSCLFLAYVLGRHEKNVSVTYELPPCTCKSSARGTKPQQRLPQSLPFPFFTFFLLPKTKQEVLAPDRFNSAGPCRAFISHFLSSRSLAVHLFRCSVGSLMLMSLHGADVSLRSLNNAFPLPTHTQTYLHTYMRNHPPGTFLS
jgi:hypothetical protein